MEIPETPQLAAFVAVATLLHFGRAAEQLHITQSTVSHRIRGLERTLGVALFSRATKRVQLTAAGVAYLQRIDGVLADLGRAGIEARDAAAGRVGRLVVGYSGALSTTGLVAAIAEVAASSPGVTIELQRRPWSEQLLALASGELDVGCSFQAAPPERPGLVVHRLRERSLYGWVGAAHPLSRRRSTTLAALREHRWITLSERAEAGFAEFLRARGGAGCGTPIEVDALDAALDLIARGVAVGVFPDTPVVPPTVRRLRLGPRAKATIRLCTAAGSLPPVVEAFVAAVQRGDQ